MINTLKLRIHQGYQTIPNIEKEEISKPFRGLPLIGKYNCKDCNACLNICPTKAIYTNPLRIDLGKCIFCGKCERICSNENIIFSNLHKLASTNRQNLFVDSTTDINNYELKAKEAQIHIKKIFGRSLKLRQVSAGGCNACEMELNACSNVNFDMGRFGIDLVASPRHADGLIITGPITKNMDYALNDAYLSTPEPKIIILAGSCAISGGIFCDSDAIKRDFTNKHKIDIYIPGCPIHPLTVINGILSFIGRSL